MYLYIDYILKHSKAILQKVFNKVLIQNPL